MSERSGTDEGTNYSRSRQQIRRIMFYSLELTVLLLEVHSKELYKYDKHLPRRRPSVHNDIQMKLPTQAQ